MQAWDSGLKALQTPPDLPKGEEGVIRNFVPPAVRDGRERRRSWRPRRGGRYGGEGSRGARERDLRGAGSSVLARLTAAGCRGNTSRRALLDQDFEWLNLSFG